MASVTSIKKPFYIYQAAPFWDAMGSKKGGGYILAAEFAYAHILYIPHRPPPKKAHPFDRIWIFFLNSLSLFMYSLFFRVGLGGVGIGIHKSSFKEYRKIFVSALNPLIDIRSISNNRAKKCKETRKIKFTYVLKLRV